MSNEGTDASAVLPSPDGECDAVGGGGGAALPAVSSAPESGSVTEDDCAEALLCARYGEVDDLKILLDAKVSVDHADPHSLSTCLHYAAANGHVDCLKLLIEYKAAYSANASGNFPLHWALEQSNSLETVKLLVAT